MKWKSIPLLLLALLITGGCVASPFIISELQNRHIFQSAMADSAVGIGDALDVSSRVLTHSEKMRLYMDFGTANSSVTCTTQRNANRTRLSEETMKDTALAELKTLCDKMQLELPFTEEDVASMEVLQCDATTYIDRDDLPCHAILWDVVLITEHYQLYFLLDDETHQIYSFSIDFGGDAVDADVQDILEKIQHAASPTMSDLVDAIIGYGDYLGLAGTDTVTEQLAIYGYDDTYRGGPAAYPYLDDNGNQFYVRFSLYNPYSFSAELTSDYNPPPFQKGSETTS